MSVQRIHLVRHGQTDWNRDKRVQGQSESTLTEQGQQQARALAPYLEGEGISRVYCSSSQRARETAQILFRAAEADIVYCDRLREIRLGPWEGRYHDEVREEFPLQFENFWHWPHQFTLDGAETFEEVQQRAMARFGELMELAEDNIALISHGVLIKTILCALEPRPLSRLWEPPLMRNCAHSIVEVDKGQPRIVQYAQVVS